MAAGQQRKRLASSNLHDHYKGKKKKRLDSSDYVLNLRSHIQLQWDDRRERVVAKREQIGITWKDMSPYVDSVPKLHSGLADVFSFPEEVFDLDNLMEVLSHEVWLTCLSESERQLLMQFLPNCVFAEQAVHSLLTGENLHFGNPFIKWSTLLCSRDLHPDVLLHKERQTRVRKKQYYLEINKYHTDLVVVLRMLKEKSETCEDPQKLWRTMSSLNYGCKKVSAEKCNDYPILPKRERPLKMCNHYVDVAKYMSYIKVNKKQFEMVKELKHSGDGIQPKSFSRVLGDIKNFNIYPYESYEDEENNKLREHWIQVTKDIPVAFDEYINKKILKMQQMKCLEKELAESRALMHYKAEESVLGNSPEDHPEFGRETEHHSIVMSDEEDSGSSFKSTHNHMLERIPSLNSHRELNSSFSEKETGIELTLKPAKDTPAPSQSVDKMDSCQMVNELKTLISPSKSAWIAVDCQDSNYQKPSGTHLFASSYDVPLKQCQPVQGQPAPMIDLERDNMEQDAGQPVPSAFNVDTSSKLFSSYSQSHDDLIPVFPVAPEILSSHAYERMDDLSQPGLQFLMDDGSLPETDRFSHLQDNQRLIKERHARDKQVYMQNVIDKNFCTNISYDNQLGYYSLAKSRCTLQSSATDGFGRQNWFPNEHQSHNGWSGIESSGNGGHSGSADESFFSVLPEYRDLPCRSSFDTSGSEQLSQARNYIGMNLADPYISTQLSSSTIYNAAPTPPMETMWMNYSHQNASLQESVRKPFMRHWRQ